MKKNIQKIIAKSIGGYINLVSHIAPKKSMQLSYKFFSEPRKGKINPTSIPNTLLKTILHEHTINGKKFHSYHWQGNEDVILLVHGWESNASRWKKIIPHLKKTGRTIIAMDAPAHGLNNDKEFNVVLYSEFINVIVQKYNPNIVIGHSIGGNALAYYQKYYSNKIKKMVLLGAPSDFKVIMKNYFEILGLNNKVQEQFQSYVEDRFNINVDEFSTSKFLEDSSILGMLVHDQEDFIVLLEEGKKISKSWTTAKYIETRGLGHSMHDANLYDKIVKFIES